MSIEFRCNQCGKLLRTGDDTAGMEARCPACGAVVPIPAAGASATDVQPHAATMTSSPVTPPPSPPGQGGGASGQAPGALPTTPAGGPTPGRFQPAMIDFGDVFARTWNIFKDQWGMCLLVLFLAILFNLVVSNGLPHGGRLIGTIVNNRELGAFLSGIGGLVGGVLSLWISIGQTLIFLGIARGDPVDLGHLFAGGPYLLRIFVASLIAGIVMFFGLLLLIVPGVFLALMFWPFYLLIVDRNVGVVDSFDIARRITDGNKATVFLLAMVTFALTVVSAIPCGIGLLFTVPFFALLWPVAYLAMTGQPTADQR